MRGLLASPDYTLRDLVAAVSNDFSRSERLFAELFAIDLSDELANMRVPYLIVQGETDIVTSTRAIRAFVAECGNPNLRYAEAPRSGHMPGTAGMDLLFARMADFLGASTPAARRRLGRGRAAGQADARTQRPRPVLRTPRRGRARRPAARARLRAGGARVHHRGSHGLGR